MTAKISTAMRNHLLEGGAFKDAVNLGFILYYTGTPPAHADDAPTGVLLSVISVGSTGVGLTLGAAMNGTIPKNASEIWTGLNVAGGVATYFRWVAPGDTGVASTTEKRAQGTIATSGADLNMTSTALGNGATSTIDAASVTMPETA
jgi:hypothetical protein